MTKEEAVFAVLGDLELDGDRPAAAAQWYRVAAVWRMTDAGLMYRLALALSRVRETAAAGRELMAHVPLLVLGDPAQAAEVAAAMRRFEGRERGDAWLAGHMRRFGEVNAGEWGVALQHLRQAAEARGDFAAALEWQKEALFFPVKPVAVAGNAMMANVALYHRLRALEALGRGDLATALGALEQQLDVAPPDAELIARTYVAMKGADAETARRANAILQRALERLQPVVRDYPEAGTYADALRRLEAMAR